MMQRGTADDYGNGQALISPPQLADYLGVPLSTLYNWRSRRIGPPAYRIGRHVRFRRFPCR